jgi:GNAT superfamily N-acetyltransferase
MHRPAPGAGVAEVREASRRDLRATATLHRAYLSDGFFARLGLGFLRRYHATFVASPLAVALVVDDPETGRPAGFLVGTLQNRSHYRWVVRRCSPQLIGQLVAALGLRPRLAWLFLRTRVGRYVRWVRRYPLRRARGGREAPPPAVGATGGVTVAAHAGPSSDDPAADALPTAPVAVLTHVAVDEALRGRGAGRRLVDDFVERAREAGAGEVRLVTEAGGGATGFYERLGWSVVGERTAADGATVREFRRPLLDAAA